MKSLRICLASARVRPAVGGEERVTEMLARGISRAGHSVSVVTQRLPGTAAAEAWERVQIRRAVRSVSWGPLFAPTYAGSLGWFLLRQRRAFDVVQATYFYWDAVVGAMLKPLLGFRLVVRVIIGGPGGDLDRFRSMRFWPLAAAWDPTTLERFVRLVVRRADAFIVLNPRIRQELLELGVVAGRCHLVPNGIEVARFATLTRPPSTGGPRRLTCVARLAEQKGVDILLQALPRVQAAAGPVKLTILGEGPERARLGRLAGRLGLEGAVHFAGVVEDVLHHLAVAEVFVLPSRYEGLPLALLEAMAAGVPAVATAVPGIADVVQDGVHGLLVPPGDPAALADAIAHLLNDPACAARMAKAARCQVARRYSLEAMVQETLAVYRGVLDAPGESPGG